MSDAKSAVSFDEIIQADRQRRKNEELANEIFGRSRKAKDSSRDIERKESRTPSLASRVGVAKRSNSSTNVKPSSFNPPSRPSSATANIARTNRLAAAVNNRQQASVSTPPLPPGPGLSIKGAAGPFVVEASNFAPGTTAADIESALQTIVTDTNVLVEATSCKIMSLNPTIIAEMVFLEKAMADAVIKTFNGQKADGRILHVHHKRNGPGSAPVPKTEPTFVSDPNPSSGKDLFETAPTDDIETEVMEDVEMAAEPTAYSDERDRSDRERRDRDRDRDREPRREGEDDHARDDRNGGRRDDRERERERDRDRDGRRYDDRRYDRRDDRGSSSRGYGPPGGGFDQRGGRPYGNGMGGFPRGGGGMYNDSPPRGGFRGGYRGFGRGRGY